jgi:hypothetical protein
LKIDRAFSLDLGLKGMKIARNITNVGVDARLPTSRKLVCAFVYQRDIQIYAQFFIPRSWSNSKLDRAFSLDLGLNWVKIARNVTNVCVDACIPTGHPKLFSNFNSEKLIKVETRSCIFARLGFKGCENSSERYESWRGRSSTNVTSKSILKFKFREVGKS